MLVCNAGRVRVVFATFGAGVGDGVGDDSGVAVGVGMGVGVGVGATPGRGDGGCVTLRSRCAPWFVAITTVLG